MPSTDKSTLIDILCPYRMLLAQKDLFNITSPRFLLWSFLLLVLSSVEQMFWICLEDVQLTKSLGLIQSWNLLDNKSEFRNNEWSLSVIIFHSFVVTCRFQLSIQRFQYKHCRGHAVLFISEAPSYELKLPYYIETAGLCLELRIILKLRRNIKLKTKGECPSR